MSYKTDGIYLGDKYYEATKSECGSGSGTSKLPSVIDGSIEVLNEEDFGDATKIRYGAFKECKKLKEVHIPETVKEVEHSAFEWSNMSNGAEVYYNGTFKYVGSDFGSPKTEIGSARYYKLNDNPYAILETFYNPDNDTEITINENCEYIIDLSLKDTTTSINIPQNVKGVFNLRASGITNLTIPDNVQYIHFIPCPNLTSITLGSGLSGIGNYCFQESPKITSITYNGTVEQWNKIELPAAWGFTQEIDVVCSDGTVKINAPKQITIKLINTGTQTVDFTPAVTGSFDMWKSSVTMTKDGNTYTATVTGTSPMEFNINNNGDWMKYMSPGTTPNFTTSTDCTITANFDDFLGLEGEGQVYIIGTLTEGV